MAQEWKPFVEYNRAGWVAGVQRKRWWGREWHYAYHWSHNGLWEFSKSYALLGHLWREKAEAVAREAADYRNDMQSRENRERFDVE